MAVLCGIDVLRRNGFREIRGQRVGLVTNHTGLTVDGRSSIDILREAPGVELVSLFSPEHGLRGQRDEKIASGVDPTSGLPVHSLYGQTTRPLPEWLKGLDALVYDIQDIGCRFYTYISTLGNCLEEAAKAGIHMVVLDRPNPITGLAVEGPIADADKLSFVAWHPIPVRHGMTVGELARLYNTERRIGAGLVVVPCDGWKRSMWWDATGLTWTNPSPNMRSMTQATLYPGIGLLETTNLSVGRGTDTPFEVIGAPWMDGRRLATHLRARRLPGVTFVPVRFKPTYREMTGEECSGVNIVITNRAAFRCLQTGVEIAVALRDTHRDQWQATRYLRLLANDAAHRALLNGERATSILAHSEHDRAQFTSVRTRHLIYS